MYAETSRNKVEPKTQGSLFPIRALFSQGLELNICHCHMILRYVFVKIYMRMEGVFL